MPYLSRAGQTTSIRKIMPTISGLRHGILASTILALILAAPIGVFAQGSKKLADTFDERYPTEQAPTQPSAERDPMQPPAEQDDAQQNRPREAAQPKKGVKVTTSTRAVSAKRSPSRVVVVPRSFLDAGTEGLPGERKFLDYAFPRIHTAMDVVANTGGRVGWHNSPLPGPFFPGHGP
jgi:hypothetical protein